MRFCKYNHIYIFMNACYNFVMNYRYATLQDARELTEAVQNTIRQIYPDFYCEEIVTAFLELHCLENITQDIKHGNTIIVKLNGKIAGTGSIEDGRHITRVYVLPQFQRQGVGGFIMNVLESKIKANGFEKAILDSSAPALDFYKKCGYKQIETGEYKVTDMTTLYYEIMEKSL